MFPSTLHTEFARATAGEALVRSRWPAAIRRAHRGWHLPTLRRRHAPAAVAQH